MPQKSKLLTAIPVLPMSNLERGVAWYEKHIGFKAMYADNAYAVLRRENVGIHLQWHANTVEDPLLGGSVVRIAAQMRVLFEEFGTVDEARWVPNTAWNTNEFGIYDLNNYAVVFMEDLSHPSKKYVIVCGIAQA